jgi:RNA methyltransferase, TrmH family
MVARARRRDLYNGPRTLDVRRISSRSNPLVARFREVARGRGPDGVILLDGEHLIDEALASGIALDTVALAETLVDALSDGLVDRVQRAGAQIVRVPPPVMAAMSPVRQPSGIVALAHARSASLDDALASTPQLVLLLNGIQDAGNVGAIVRAADGCGATGVIAAEGTADPFSWKALRGAMGSTFRLPIAVRQSAPAAVSDLQRRGVTVVATVPRHGTPLPACELRGPVAILLGGEGAGLPEGLLTAADERLSIPMRPPVESFNVAITAALILYEAAKQRDGHVPVR